MHGRAYIYVNLLLKVREDLFEKHHTKAQRAQRSQREEGRNDEGKPNRINYRRYCRKFTQKSWSRII